VNDFPSSFLRILSKLERKISFRLYGSFWFFSCEESSRSKNLHKLLPQIWSMNVSSFLRYALSRWFDRMLWLGQRETRESLFWHLLWLALVVYLVDSRCGSTNSRLCWQKLEWIRLNAHMIDKSCFLQQMWSKQAHKFWHFCAIRKFPNLGQLFAVLEKFLLGWPISQNEMNWNRKDQN